MPPVALRRPISASPRVLFRVAAWMLLAAALSTPRAHGAAEGRDAAAEPAMRSGAKAEAVADVARAAAPAEIKRDPMDLLREKLAARLGAVKAPDAASRNVLRVVSRSDSTPPAAVVAAPRSRERTEGIVAALRAEKAVPAAVLEHRSVSWAYDGEGGPEVWGRLKPEFAKCGNGSRQSPIDIRGGIAVDLEPIQFDYRPSGFTVLDTGHTVQVKVGPGNMLEVMGRRYELVQFHFHRPSEERVNGRSFDMVVHMVHKDAEGRLAVLAVLLERGHPHALVQTVWNNLPLEKGDELPARAAIDPGELLPKDRRYYTYMGSLTTPPCSEGVLWMVMQQPATLSSEQIAIFARLYPMNARPVQSASGRLIKQSN